MFFPRAHAPRLLAGGGWDKLASAAAAALGAPHNWATARAAPYLEALLEMAKGGGSVPAAALSLLERAMCAAPAAPLRAVCGATLRAWLRGRDHASVNEFRDLLCAYLRDAPPAEVEQLAGPLGDRLAEAGGLAAREPKAALALADCAPPPQRAQLREMLLRGLLSGAAPAAASSGACAEAAALLLWPPPGAVALPLADGARAAFAGQLLAALRGGGAAQAEARLRAALALPCVAAALAVGDAHTASLGLAHGEVRAARVGELAPGAPLDALRLVEEAPEPALRAQFARALLRCSLPAAPAAPPWLSAQHCYQGGLAATSAAALAAFLWEPSRGAAALPADELAAPRARFCELLLLTQAPQGAGGRSAAPLLAALAVPALLAAARAEGSAARLVMGRVDYLEKHCGAHLPGPAGSWAFPAPAYPRADSAWPAAQATGHAGCDAFLRSEEQQATLTGFDSLPEARHLATRLASRFGAALHAEEGGRAKEAFVRVGKSAAVAAKELARVNALHEPLAKERRKLLAALPKAGRV